MAQGMVNDLDALLAGLTQEERRVLDHAPLLHMFTHPVTFKEHFGLAGTALSSLCEKGILETNSEVFQSVRLTTLGTLLCHALWELREAERAFRSDVPLVGNSGISTARWGDLVSLHSGSPWRGVK